LEQGRGRHERVDEKRRQPTRQKDVVENQWQGSRLEESDIAMFVFTQLSNPEDNHQSEDTEIREQKCQVDLVELDTTDKRKKEGLTSARTNGTHFAILFRTKFAMPLSFCMIHA